MKTISTRALFCVAALLFLFSQKAAAQVEIGVKVSPSVTYLRTLGPKDANLKNDGSTVGIGFGVIADYFFGTNYAINSGILFNVKGGNITYRENASNNNPKNVSAEINLHYIEIPLAIKLYTNEVAPDIRAYFNAGASLNTLVGARVNGEKVDDNTDKFTEKFNLFEIGAIIGAGAEMQMGTSTKVFGGLTYQHGLSNTNDSFAKETGKFELKNSGFSLDIGIKF